MGVVSSWAASGGLKGRRGAAWRATGAPHGRSRRSVCWVAALAAVLAAPPAARPATYVVDARSGDDAAPGTAQSPLRTISGAVERAVPGDTILVRAGLYRERVRFVRSGEPGRPIRLEAAPGQRVVLSGADPIRGWSPCTAQLAAGNPHWRNLFVADLDWRPKRLFEAGRELICARTPDTGWWSISRGLSLTEFIDSRHLTQEDPRAWEGWTVAILEQAGGSIQHIPVAAFDPQAHKITLARPYSRYRERINEARDRYFMENHLTALDGPGQYVIHQTAAGCRLFLWPRRLGPDGQPAVEAPRRGTLVTITGISHVVIDGLEVCYSTGAGIGSSMAKPNRGVLIQNCYIHHNAGYGIQKRQSEDLVVRRNVIRHNSHGVVMGRAVRALVEENDIGPNRVDGVIAAGHCRGVTIQRNYIHDHSLWGHPDNLQFWNDVRDVVIRDNVLVNAGQTMMSEGLHDVKLVNNLWLGSRAVSMIIQSDGAEVRHNTVVAVATPTNWQGRRFLVECNVFAPLRDMVCYGVPHEASFRSDHNLLWNGRQGKMPLVVVGRWEKALRSIDEIRAEIGQERHGMVAQPSFRSAARYFTTTHYARISECTASRLILRQPHSGQMAVGDHIELNFDGVVRTVTAVGKDWVEFQPALAEPPVNGAAIANWGRQTDFTWDLRLADDSPGRRLAPDGRAAGCDLDLQAYRRGDFDGDGRSELPPAPGSRMR
ncbi:MAG TPA: DUF1565 domain-containing protein [Planctomycetaceae bacterium]|nr:DUF1565 domain-containing protein [Planctomycetaceae bacterium]